MIWTNNTIQKRVNNLYNKMRNSNMNMNEKRMYCKGSPSVNKNGAMLWTPKSESIAKARVLRKWYNNNVNN